MLSKKQGLMLTSAVECASEGHEVLVIMATLNDLWEARKWLMEHEIGRNGLVGDGRVVVYGAWHDVAVAYGQAFDMWILDEAVTDMSPAWQEALAVIAARGRRETTHASS